MNRLIMIMILSMLTIGSFATVKPRYAGWQYDWVARSLMSQAEQDAPSAGTPRRIGIQATAPLNSLGTPRIPVILVQFPDLKFTAGLPEGQTCETPEQILTVNDFYDLYCNGRDDGSYFTDGGSYGSIREYFRDQSFGLFTPQFTVLGPVTLENSYVYYGQDNGNLRDANVSQFYSEAITQAQSLISNWSLFDNDANGTVDMAFFVFAGPGENSYNLTRNPEAKDYIWPHERQSGGTLGGVRYGCYACCNETYGNQTDGIGVFVHELSHALGLPDLYDTNYIAFGLDYWDIMDSGCYDQSGYWPCGYSAYERDFMGWQKLEQLDPSEPQHLVLQPLHKGGKAYKILNPDNSNEYYIIENRQPDSWDTYLGHGTERTKMHGMLMTHIDYYAAAWTSNRVNSTLNHQRCTIIPANDTIYSWMYVTSTQTLNDFYLATTSTQFPGRTGVTAFENKEEVIMPYDDKILNIPIAYTGTYQHPLRNIVETADGNIELDYCPYGKLPTSIERLDDDPLIVSNDDVVYDLQGRRVTTNGQSTIANGQLPKGIYIRNGKKVYFF